MSLFFLLSFLTAQTFAESLTDSLGHMPLTQQRNPGPLTIPRLLCRPVIDGDLRDSVWCHALVLKNFVQTFPGDNVSPTYPTEVLLGYSQAELYIGIHATDDSSRVRATLAKRDDILNDDYIKI